MKNTRNKKMSTVQTLMKRYPLLSVMLLVLFTLVFIMALFSLIIEIILPAVISFWLAGWIYTVLVGQPWIRNIYEPFWFIRTG